MAAVSEEIRRITVDGIRYGWRVTHRHRPTKQGSTQRICVTRFMAFREGTSRAPLRISFVEGSTGGPGYIQEHGVVLVHGSSIVLNLHLPGTAAALIRRAVDRGWSSDRPFDVGDGFEFLTKG